MKRTIIFFIAGIFLSTCGQTASDPTLPPPSITQFSEYSPTPNQNLMAAEITSIDDTWNQYTNYRLGITLKNPKLMHRIDADCYWNETDTDHSFRPLGGFVPVIVIEGEDRIYITSEFYSELIQPTQLPGHSGGYRTEFAGCEKVENNLIQVSSRDYYSYIWDILVRKIESEADLEAMIDEYYGECFHLGEMTESEYGDMVQVKILGDGKPVEESTCLLRGGYVFLYSPGLDRAAIWWTGQALDFIYDPTRGLGYDAEMIHSFQFLSD